jgi:hypothetical protein
LIVREPARGATREVMDMVQDVWWTWMWVQKGSTATPFMFTHGISGIGGRNVIAEASLSKFALGAGGDPKHVKAAVWHFANMTGTSQNWGIDGDPIRWLFNANYMTFALEVAGPYTFAWMTGKLYVF